MGKLRETLDARMITPMQEFVEADDDFDVDTLLPAVRAEYTVEDALQFMPQGASNNVIFFNVDAVAEAGLDPSLDVSSRWRAAQAGVAAGGWLLSLASGYDDRAQCPVRGARVPLPSRWCCWS